MPYGLPTHPIMEHEAKDDAIRDLYERLDKIETGRQSLINALWAQIPADVTEHAYTPTATSLTVPPITEELVKVTAVVATLPAGATGTLQLGDVVVFLGTPSVNLMGLRILLRGSDTRLVQATKAGPISVVISGQVAPTRGIL